MTDGGWERQSHLKFRSTFVPCSLFLSLPYSPFALISWQLSACALLCPPHPASLLPDSSLLGSFSRSFLPSVSSSPLSLLLVRKLFKQSKKRFGVPLSRQAREDSESAKLFRRLLLRNFAACFRHLMHAPPITRVLCL